MLLIHDLVFPILTLSNSDAFKFWHFQILTLSNFAQNGQKMDSDTLQFWNFPISLISELFGQKSLKIYIYIYIYIYIKKYFQFL